MFFYRMSRFQLSSRSFYVPLSLDFDLFSFLMIFVQEKLKIVFSICICSNKVNVVFFMASIENIISQSSQLNFENHGKNYERWQGELEFFLTSLKVSICVTIFSCKNDILKIVFFLYSVLKEV